MVRSKSRLIAITTSLVFLASCDAATTGPAPGAPAIAPETVAAATDALAQGTFEGRSDHVTTGTASIIGASGSYSLVFSSDFELDGAPDPIVGFGNDGTFDLATELGALTNRTGEQTYSLPADFNLESTNEVYVWCKQFSVPLGVATLTRTQ